MRKNIKESEDNYQPEKQSYCRVSIMAREKLIKLVIQRKFKIASAAKIAKINESTAKMIIRKFRSSSQEIQCNFLNSGAKSEKIQAENEQKQQAAEGQQILQYFILPLYYWPVLY